MDQSLTLGGLAQGNIQDMAGGAPPSAQNPGGTMAGFDKTLFGYEAVVRAVEALSALERQSGDDSSSAKLKQMAATINSMRAAKVEKANKLKAEMQGAMLGV